MELRSDSAHRKFESTIQAAMGAAVWPNPFQGENLSAEAVNTLSKTNPATATATIPDGNLKDGTALYGPFYEKPKPDLQYIETKAHGRLCYVVYGSKAISPDQVEEIKRWAESAIATSIIRGPEPTSK
jgi:hypothetical protein